VQRRSPGKDHHRALNNGTYGTIRMHQERDYPQRVSGSHLFNPDFAALARPMGMRAARWARSPRRRYKKDSGSTSAGGGWRPISRQEMKKAGRCRPLQSGVSRIT
jgi:hypothetical protein